MSLVALLIALTVERIRHPHRKWHFKLLYQQTFSYLSGKALFSQQGANWGYWLVLLAPVILMQLLLHAVSGYLFGLFTFLIWITIPIWIIGCPGYQKLYRQYLQAAAEGDAQACQLFAQGLSRAEHSALENTPQLLACEVGQQLMWINYRYYFAVIFYFVLLGPAGGLAYAGIRELAQWECDNPHSNVGARRVIRVLDWLPARLVIFGMALVGNFSSVLPLWLASLVDVKTSERQWIAKAAVISEPVDTQSDNLCIKTTCNLVAIAKRNTLLFLSLVALLTIYGWLL